MVILFSSRQFMENLKKLFVKNLQFEKILGGSSLPLLTTLAIPEMAAKGRQGKLKDMTIEQIILFSGLSRDTVYRTMDNLIMAGGVNRIGKCYRISNGIPELEEFIEQFAYNFASGVVNEITSEFESINDNKLKPIQTTIRFVAGGEIIFSIPYGFEVKMTHPIIPTGLTAFIQDGLIFHTSVNYYHYSIGQRNLRKEDFALDHLLVDPTSVRNVSYVMLYLLKNKREIDWDYLIAIGSLFGLQEMVINIVDYLIKLPLHEVEYAWPIPKIKEFIELCDLYGVRY